MLTGANTLAVALPTFVTGVILVLVFGIVFPVLPTGGVPPDGFLAEPGIAVQYLVLPAVCLALPASAALTRFLAEASAQRARRPVHHHGPGGGGVGAAPAGGPRAARRAAHLPDRARASRPASLLGGAVLVEAVFNWPGLGQLAAQAIDRRDYPVVQILLLLSVAVFVVIQLATDLVHAWLDPRIRIGGLT